MYPYLELFGQKLQSYYVCAACAGILGVLLSVRALRKEKQGAWAVFLPLCVGLSALIGARALNYITNPAAFSESFPVWTLSYRKLSLMGGLVMGLGAVILYCLLKKESFPKIADAFTVPAAAGIVLLKLGCFLNGCCHGKPTDGPFGVIFPANAVKYDFINSLKVVSAKSPVVHPTQIYEIVGAVIAVTAAVLLPKVLKLKEGNRAAIFAILFSMARWIILPLRELPYEKQVIATFYPCLYAGIIILSASYLVLRNYLCHSERPSCHSEPPLSS